MGRDGLGFTWDPISTRDSAPVAALFNGVEVCIVIYGYLGGPPEVVHAKRFVQVMVQDVVGSFT